VGWRAVAEPEPATLVFPAGFLWGAATAAYQVEGGITANNWAQWEVDRDVAPERRCGRAVEHWQRFDEDLELMRWLGLSAYRFSVEWSRVEPLPGWFDPEPMRRYRRWCERLREAGIAPLVTLHHFSEPVWLTERGGFEEHAAVAAFVRFAEHVAAGLGDLVEVWITVNEPVGYAVQGWWRGVWPPGRTEPATAVRVLANLLLAHAGAYRALHRGPRAAERRVGLAHNIVEMRPGRRLNPADRFAARLLDAAYNGAALEALATGRLRLQLPGLRHIVALPELVGTQDYLGVNHYHPLDVRLRPTRPERIEAGFGDDGDHSDLGWPLDPCSLTRTLRRLARFGLPMLVLEHGVCDGDADDLRRRRFLGHSLAALRAAVDGGLDVRGYVHWSLLDNYEWTLGHTRFGLFRVDQGTLSRSPTSSARYYRRILATQPAAGLGFAGVR
jgi:beta-glucosidase